MTHPPSVPPAAGWYSNGYGQRQWWDGTAWGPLAEHPTPAQAVISAPSKTRTAAYLLAIFLGGVGAHRFYLRKIGTAWLLIVLWLVAFLFGLDNDRGSAAISGLTIAVMALWIIIDLFRIPSMVDEINAADAMKRNVGSMPISARPPVEQYPLRRDWRS